LHLIQFFGYRKLLRKEKRGGGGVGNLNVKVQGKGKGEGICGILSLRLLPRCDCSLKGGKGREGPDG